MPDDLPRQSEGQLEGSNPFVENAERQEAIEEAIAFLKGQNLSRDELFRRAAERTADRMELYNENKELKRRLAEVEAQLTEERTEGYRREIQLTMENEELAHQGTIDPLTGLLNKKTLERTLSLELERASREEKAVSVLVTDLDKFKRLNDGLGHLSGDVAIKLIGKIIEEIKRPYDHAARFGGEEFVLVLPGANAKDAAKVGQRLRAKIESDFKQELLKLLPEQADKINSTSDDDRTGEKGVPMVLGTTSIGVSTYNGKDHIEGEALFKQADDALGKGAKINRNSVVHFDDLEIAQKATPGEEAAAKKAAETPLPDEKSASKAKMEPMQERDKMQRL